MTSLYRIRTAFTGFVGAPGVSTMYSLNPPTDLADLQALWTGLKGGMPTDVTISVLPSGDIIEDTTGALTGQWAGLQKADLHGGVSGGYPVDLPAMSLGEVMVKPTTMLYRNFLAMEVEELLRSLKRFAPELSATQIDESGDFLAEDYGEGWYKSGENAMTPVDVLESKQADACFDVCLLALSAAHRDTLQRCLLAGQSEATIAVETGQSLGTVKSRKHYAVRKMQGCVLECVNDHRSGSRKGASHG